MRSLNDLTGPWQLFVDDALIARRENVQRVYHPFEKHPANPVLQRTLPCEGEMIKHYGTVLPREDGTGWRMWYQGYEAAKYRACYAESEDGLQWHKPESGGEALPGNLAFPPGEDHALPQVIHTPWDRSAPYKYMAFDYGRQSPDRPESGYYAALSQDALSWRPYPDGPALPDRGDVGHFVWDPHTGRYIAYPKFFAPVRGAERRCVGFSTTDDFAHWPPSQQILAPDEIDDAWVDEANLDAAANPNPTRRTDLYGLAGFAYESMYIGILWLFRITDGDNDGDIFPELVSSRDGVTWNRAEPTNGVRPRLLEYGPSGAWDSRLIYTSGNLVAHEDRLRLYYTGMNFGHRRPEPGEEAAVGLASIRKDGFVSLEAHDREGTITTCPLSGLPGTELRINANARRGRIRAAVLGTDEQEISGFSTADCTSAAADGIGLPVRWASERSCRRRLRRCDSTLKNRRFTLLRLGSRSRDNAARRPLCSV